MYIRTKYIGCISEAFLSLVIHFACIVCLLLFILSKIPFIQKSLKRSARRVQAYLKRKEPLAGLCHFLSIPKIYRLIPIKNIRIDIIRMKVNIR